jgi:hypothetical protein
MIRLRNRRGDLSLSSLWLLATALLCSFSSMQAQQVIDIPPTPACRGCTIEVQRIAVLGQEDGPGTIDGDDAHAAVDSRGRYFLWQQYMPEVKVFDARGRYLRRLGREGRGPGEFRGVGAIRIGAGDSIHVFDANNLTRSLFSPSFAFVRSTRLEVPPEILRLAMLDGGSFVISAPIRTPSRVGFPLHLVNSTGRIVRSFGSASGAFRPDIPYFDRRSITFAGPGQVWAAHVNQYRIELWSTEGRKVRELRRTVPWFPPYLASREPSRSTPPPTLLGDVRQDRDGRLWVRISVPDANWRRAVQPGGPHGVTIPDYNQYLDTIIEVIDPRRGRLLASRRFDADVHFVGDNLLGGVVTGEDDVPYYHVWRVRFNHGRRG